MQGRGSREKTPPEGTHHLERFEPATHVPGYRPLIPAQSGALQRVCLTSRIRERYWMSDLAWRDYRGRSEVQQRKAREAGRNVRHGMAV